MDRLLHRPPGAGETLLVDRELVSTRVDRLAQPDDREIGQLLRDDLEAGSDLVELSGHGGDGIGS